MFGVVLWNTYLVFAGAPLKQVVKLLWTFKVPWHWAYHGTLFSPRVAQFAFGFYSIMLTPTILGLITMILVKPHMNKFTCFHCRFRRRIPCRRIRLKIRARIRA